MSHGERANRFDCYVVAGQCVTREVSGAPTLGEMSGAATPTAVEAPPLDDRDVEPRTPMKRLGSTRKLAAFNSEPIFGGQWQSYMAIWRILREVDIPLDGGSP
ncbi:unnamed protein product [Arctia plantaginis]|uniref:Uncharacterized protein n=1 Tax=Arctia plantaginis TaxID=874455 RepID=A0A8S0Z5F5_ARCPL|nr:unnamed protein product [Arctia plantaginis]CAB3228163.1 unnamed protein product [Arctia plantaginis]